MTGVRQSAVIFCSKRKTAYTADPATQYTAQDIHTPCLEATQYTSQDIRTKCKLLSTLTMPFVF